MQQAVADQVSVYRQEFDARRAPVNEPEWLTARRADAIAAFEAQGFPTRRWEEWRNTNLRRVTQAHFTLPAEPEQIAPREGFALPDGYRIQILNGHIAPTHTMLGGLPEGVHIEPLSMSLYRQDPLVERLWGRVLGDDLAPFAALNDAFAHDGAVIRVGRGVVLDKPLLLEFVAHEAAGHALYPRVLILLEEGAEAQIVEYYRGYGDEPYLTSAVTEIELEANAGLSWYKLQEEAESAYHFGTVKAWLARDARLRTHSLSAGAQLARTDMEVVLNGEGADLSMDGLYLARDKQFTDHHTIVDHRVGHCFSRQRFKGVLAGKSEAVYDGLIKVGHGAAKTEAEQQNRNLLLSRRALAHSNPRLEIYTDDVKCAHGSTVGELDEDALFYLRTRGIDDAAARALLTTAFADELLEPIAIEPLREYERGILAAMLADEQPSKEGA